MSKTKLMLYSLAIALICYISAYYIMDYNELIAFILLFTSAPAAIIFAATFAWWMISAWIINPIRNLKNRKKK